MGWPVTLLLVLGTGVAHGDPFDNELSPGAALPIVRFGGLDQDEPSVIAARLAYGSVDGAAFHVGYRYHDATRLRPRLFVEAGYATARERGLWSVELSQPILKEDRLVLGAGGWHATRHFTFDGEIVGSSENTLAAFFFQEDYRDHFDAEGVRFFGSYRWSPRLALDGELTAEDETGLENATDWAVFRDDGFRDNRIAATGSRRSVRIGITHDTRPHDRREGIPFIGAVPRRNEDLVRLTWEGAGGALGGDFEYGLLRLDARGFLNLGAHQFLAARVLGGSSTGGTLPPQAALYVGGISTLRAHPHKTFQGDRLALLNVDYSIDAWKMIQGLLFLDFGSAWVADDNPNGPKMAIDAGVGLQTRDQHLRVHLARDLSRSDGGVVLSVRTNATF